MKPMLAETITDISTQVKFPIYASIKLDGIRCLIRDGKAVSRALKPIGNDHIRTELERFGLHGMDGEILTYNEDGTVKTLNQINGDVSRSSGTPVWTYNVFDCTTRPEEPFEVRYSEYRNMVKQVFHPRIVAHQQHWTGELSDLELFEDSTVLLGHEGVMVRSVRGHYKHGRSTVKEGLLLKLKRFSDDEAVITGFEERMHNGNEAFTNELGRTARSSDQAGMVPMDTLGALVLDWKGVEFKLGTGFDDDLRQEIWNNRPEYLGGAVTFNFKGIGSNGRPLIASFKAFR